MSDNDPQGAVPKSDDVKRHGESTAYPLYRKPVLRKYDQIEQVKPYGPSEMEAS